MNNQKSYYENRNQYGSVCVPRRENILNYLIKEKFLGEFCTEEEKNRVLSNLGILQQLSTIISDINNIKSSLRSTVNNEEFNRKINNLQRTIDSINLSLREYVTIQELRRRIEEIRPKDEKSKGYYSSYEELLQNNLTNNVGDWAIVNIDGIWYIYKYTNRGWTESGTYDNNIDLNGYVKNEDLIEYIKSNDLLDYVKRSELSEFIQLSDLENYVTNEELTQILNNYTPGGEISPTQEGITPSQLNQILLNFQEKLESGINLKTINGESLLGEGNINLSVSGDYLTREEYFSLQNPLKIRATVSPSLLEYTGNSYDVIINFNTTKGSNAVPAIVNLSYGTTQLQEISSPISVQVSNTTTFNITCQYQNEQDSTSVKVNIVKPTYIGFNINESIDVDLSTLTKKIQTSIGMTETISNQIAGSYLWIVSPYQLNSVATDPSYTYKVAMVTIGNSNELNYYRSNSPIDISNLTYYIK